MVLANYRWIYGQAQRAERRPVMVYGPDRPRRAVQLSPKVQAKLFIQVMTVGMLFLCFGVWNLASQSNEVPAQPRRLNGECGLSVEELEDREEVRKSGFFIWESLATSRSDRCTSREGPCLKKQYHGWLCLYLFGMFYMFIALAIVCDEFFVPSLECFTEEFHISPDVAGATFMAAGGSMPELFTSFVSTMRDNTGVGMATIVGSAVFNVLFVIAVCAVASKEPLDLTWWPLARDTVFYLVTLFTVLIFFKFSSCGIIEWWEACLLLLEYILYCTFMKFNARIQGFVKHLLGTKVQAAEGTRDLISDATNEEDEPEKFRHFHNPSAFRAGIVQLLAQGTSLADTVGIAAVTQIKGSLSEYFSKLDTDGDGFLNEEEVGTALRSLGLPSKNPDELRSAVQGIARNRAGLISFENFEKWYIASEERVQIEVRRVWDRLASESTGTVDKNRISSVLKKLGHSPSEEEVQKTVKDILLATRAPEEAVASREDEDLEKVEINFDQFEAWYQKSLFWYDHHKKHCDEEEAEGFSIDLPDSSAGWMNWGWFILTYPLCSMMYVTMVDVRNGRIGSGIRPELAGCWKVAIFEFFLSLFWIAIFATCLYEWVVISSNTIGVPPTVSAITFLAAGTSVPDLLSSYVVARQGEGDMAVSSSLGSNLFDVTVGLPLPWLIYCGVYGRPVTVATDSLGVSILLLIVMLASVVLTVMICKWRMTRLMGVIMLFLYIVFVLQELLRSDLFGEPVFRARLLEGC